MRKFIQFAFAFLFVFPGNVSARDATQRALCEAINESEVITLWYKPGQLSRKVLPRYLGQTRSGNWLLNGWQISGYSSSGGIPAHRSFRLDRVTRMDFTGEKHAPMPHRGRLPSGLYDDTLVCFAQ
jgi:hypothetical protein